jgi:hypothetical protein
VVAELKKNAISKNAGSTLQIVALPTLQTGELVTAHLERDLERLVGQVILHSRNDQTYANI